MTKFLKNCHYFATTVLLSHTATAQSRSIFTNSGSSKKDRLRLHNTACKYRLLKNYRYQFWDRGVSSIFQGLEGILTYLEYLCDDPR